MEHESLIGIAIQTALFLLGGYAMVIKADIGARNLKEEVHEMKEQLERLSEVITVQAVQTTRLDNLTSLVASMEKRVEDLRRGQGYVERRDHLGKVIDREY